MSSTTLTPAEYLRELGIAALPLEYNPQIHALITAPLEPIRTEESPSRGVPTGCRAPCNTPVRELEEPSNNVPHGTPNPILSQLTLLSTFEYGSVAEYEETYAHFLAQQANGLEAINVPRCTPNAILIQINLITSFEYGSVAEFEERYRRFLARQGNGLVAITYTLLVLKAQIKVLTHMKEVMEEALTRFIPMLRM